MTSALSPESVADLRACARVWGVDAVLEEARHRREELSNPLAKKNLKLSLDSSIIFSADAEQAQRKIAVELSDPESEGDPAPLRKLVAEDRERWVRWAVRQLPLPDKKVIRMKYWDELPLCAIAGEIGCGVHRADQIHHRALSRLRHWLVMGWYAGENPS